MKKGFNFSNIIRAVFIMLAVLSVITYFTSPVYKVANGNLETGDLIIINKPLPEVYAYVSNSANAAKWSSFVHHISLLEGMDGELHCKRRCFKNIDEAGIQWDEEILLVDPFQTRRLSIYNAKGFSIYIDGLMTEQRYTQEANISTLSLVLILPKGASLWDKIKFYIGAFKVRSVFASNLKNIKTRIEEQ